MNGREALKALVDGKTIRSLFGSVAKIESGEFRVLCDDGQFREAGDHFASNLLKSDRDWELYVAPATDEELIVAIVALKEQAAFYSKEREAFSICAEMLRTRKIP